jgi:hypothetical protein
MPNLRIIFALGVNKITYAASNSLPHNLADSVKMLREWLQFASLHTQDITI